MEEEGVVELNLKRSEDRDPSVQKIGQEQIHELLFGEKLSWQAIIYDLINTEQLDPWDLDISLLSYKYLEKIKEFEEHNFFVSSKVLLAATLLLRIKSEILLHQDIPRLDDILFGKKEEKRYIQERIELDDDIPGLVPRTPLPRYRKVTLEELMAALGNAIKTETRRIRKVVIEKQAEMETSFSLPKRRFNLKDKIVEVHDKLKEIFLVQDKKLAFSKLLEGDDEGKVAIFVPLLHLDTQEKIWLEQEAPFEEIWIWLKELYETQNKELLEEMRKEAEGALSEFEDNPEMEKSELKTEDDDEEEGVNEFGFKDRRDKEERDEDE